MTDIHLPSDLDGHNGRVDQRGGVWPFPPPHSPPTIAAVGPVLPVQPARPTGTVTRTAPAPVGLSRQTARARARCRRRRHLRHAARTFGLALIIGGGATIAVLLAFLLAGGQA